MPQAVALRGPASQLALSGRWLRILSVITVGGDSSSNRRGVPDAGESRGDGSSTKGTGSFVDPGLDAAGRRGSWKVSHGGDVGLRTRSGVEHS